MDVCYLMSVFERDGSVPLSLILVFLFQLIYIVDLLIDEVYIFTSMFAPGFLLKN